MPFQHSYTDIDDSRSQTLKTGHSNIDLLTLCTHFTQVELNALKRSFTLSPDCLNKAFSERADQKCWFRSSPKSLSRGQ